MAYDIGEAFEEIENELIQSMMRNLKRHRIEEKTEGYEWSQWQTEQLKALEEYRLRNLKKFGPQFQNINAKVDTLLRALRGKGGVDQEKEILKAIKKGFQATRLPEGIYGEFFKTNDRKLNALIKATVNDLENAEIAVLRKANDSYRQTIFNAQVYANTGAGTYAKAVDMATRDFLRAGINCIQYSNGSMHTISDYADMALRTVSKRAYLMGEGEMRRSWGISTVIMNRRSDFPCPKCVSFVGKILIDDVWSGGKASDGPYELMSSAIERGLYHPRCRDSHTTYFEGITEVREATQEESKRSVEKYNAEQKENYAKRQAEKFGRLAKYSLDEENKAKYEKLMKKWEE